MNLAANRLNLPLEPRTVEQVPRPGPAGLPRLTLPRRIVPEVLMQKNIAPIVSAQVILTAHAGPTRKVPTIRVGVLIHQPSKEVGPIVIPLTAPP